MAHPDEKLFHGIRDVNQSESGKYWIRVLECYFSLRVLGIDTSRFWMRQCRIKQNF